MKGSGLLLSAPTSAEQGPHQFPAATGKRLQLPTATELDPTYSDPIEEKEIIRLRTSLLQERLDVLETLTRNCQSLQRAEKADAERCMSDLATQVSRAVSLQQLMKSEVEKLQERVGDLERHNKALATMIVPTLVRFPHPGIQEFMDSRKRCSFPGFSSFLHCHDYANSH